MTVLPPPDWPAARAALSEAAHRVAGLVRSARRPDALALGEWTVTDVASHLCFGLEGLTRLAAGSLSPLADVWALADLAAAGVRADPERDLGVLAGRIEAGVDAFLAAIPPGSADDDVPWLVQGITVPLSTLTCHLLNESLVHGFDIARAEGVGWSIPKPAARLVLTSFILAVFERLPARAMVDQRAAAGVKASFDLRVRGGDRTVWVFDDGALTLHRPATLPVDCHISADPVHLLLLAWGRRSQREVLARGGLAVWGRRPWLGPRLLPMMRNP